MNLDASYALNMRVHAVAEISSIRQIVLLRQTVVEVNNN